MSRVFVTGATGFVGLPVARRLVAAGHRLCCAVRPGRARALEGLSVETIECEDVFAQTPEWWAQTLDGFDAVVHVAWYAEPGKYLTSERNLHCLAGTLALARGAAAAGVERFLGVGTCFEYDLTAGRLSVDTPLAPQTPYAACKVAAWFALRAWFEQTGVRFLWARLFYLHGAREDRRRLVPYLHERLAAGLPAELTSGTALRDYMDVEDAAAMLVRDFDAGRQGAVNICSGEGVTIRALAERIADTYGRRDLLRFGARPENLTDPPAVIGVRDEDDHAR